MPSASSKPSQTQALMEGNDIAKSGLLLVEKKVRNLEKRKIKLDAYKKQMDGGQELNADQKAAIANLKAVEMNLEMAKDLHKQFQQMNLEYNKQQKKQARRDQIAVQQAQHNADVLKVREVLELQSLMDNLSEDVRADFLSGTGGAVEVTEREFGQIDDFYKLITPDPDSDVEAAKQLASASEHIVNLLSNSTSAVAGTTYKDLRDVVEKIKKCGYFDPSKATEEAAEEAVEEDESSGSSTPNGDLSGSGEDITTEDTTVAAQVVAEEKEPELASEPQQPVVDQTPVAPVTGDVSSFTANEHGLNFLCESEVEAKAEPAGHPAAAAPDAASGEWVEQQNGDHHAASEHAGEAEDSQGTNNGFTQMRGGGRGGFRGSRGGFRGGNDRGGPRRGGRGGYGPPRGGGGFGGQRGGGQQQDGYRRGGGGGRGGRGFPSRGGPRGGRRGGNAPQQ